MEGEQRERTLKERIRRGQIRQEDVTRRLAELAFGKANDCVRLALEDEPELNRLDLSLLSEVKRNEKGTVEIKLIELEYATEFSAVQNRQVQRDYDPETQVETITNEELIWTIAIQEQLPEYFVLEDEKNEAFRLAVYHNTYIEIFHHCYWLSITLEENESGILRKRVARSWSNRILQNI